MSWTLLCPLTDLTEDKGRFLEAEGRQLALFLHQGTVYVLDNYCPHAGGNMAAGWVEDGCAVCPRHNWPFRLDTGELKSTPAVSLQVYPTRIIDHNQTPWVQADLPPLNSFAT